MKNALVGAGGFAKDIVMLGAGGFASEVLEMLEQTGARVIKFVYEGAIKGEYCGISVDDFDCLKEMKLDEVRFICAVGTPEIRRKLVEKAKSYGAKFATFIHPRSYVSPKAKIGEGCIIQSNCILLGHSIEIGDFVTMNDNVAIGHGVKVGNFTHINPNVNISGEAILEEDVFVGVKATILKVRVGNNAVIGACALITKDVPANTMAKGMPAQIFPKTEKRYRDNDTPK